MSKRISAWPALEGFEGTAQLSFERGVWGKAHGARTDFRWLAASEGFAAYEQPLARQLYLGPEDRPCRMFGWRCLGREAVALIAYPSPAADASGRRGFLEKQVLAWRMADDVPPAATALALLAAAESLDDSAWWPRRAEVDWSRPSSRLVLGRPEHRTIRLDRSRLGRIVADAVESLTAAALDEEALARLYGEWIMGRRPGRLAGLDAPLPAGAVAALLLPLARPLVDRASVTGWLPSSRADGETLGIQWDLVVEPPGVDLGSVARSPSEPPAEAWAAASALLAGDPSRLLPGGLLVRSVVVPTIEGRTGERPEAGSQTTGSPQEAPEPGELSPDEPAAQVADAEAAAADREAAKTAVAIDWNQAMRDDLLRGTDLLIEQGCWEAWRRGAQLQPKGEQRTAMAWMTSPVWARPDAPTPTWEAWVVVLADLGMLDQAAVSDLFSGPGTGRTWPWCRGRETEQMKGLAKKMQGSAALDLLRRGLERDRPLALDRPLREVLASTEAPSPNSTSDSAALLPPVSRHAVGRQAPFAEVIPPRLKSVSATSTASRAATFGVERRDRNRSLYGLLVFGLAVLMVALLLWRLAQGRPPVSGHLPTVPAEEKMP